MAERYSKLSSIEENLYCVGSPVLIQAGSLLKDNETGKILGQFKFKNLSNKVIKALLVHVDAFDVSGRQVAGVSEFQYLDLFAERNVSFGQKIAIPLPDSVTRSVQIYCISVVFEDGSSWNGPEYANWVPLPKQQCLADILTTSLVEQYQRETYTNADFVPLDYQDLWLCTCGEINHKDEERCYCCKNVKADLLAALNEDELSQHSTEYLAEQQAIAKAESIKKAERSKQTKKKLIIGSIASVVVLIILLFTVILPAQEAAEQREIIDKIKASAQSEVCNTIRSNSFYYRTSSEINAMLSDMVVTYENEKISGDEYSVTAKYRVELSEDYYCTYEFMLTANISTGSGNLHFIDYYES